MRAFYSGFMWDPGIVLVFAESRDEARSLVRAAVPYCGFAYVHGAGGYDRFARQFSEPKVFRSNVECEAAGIPAYYEGSIIPIGGV